MSGHPTPRVPKAPNEANTYEATLKKNQIHGWRLEICQKVRNFDSDIDNYLRTFLSSQTPYVAAIGADVLNMASKFEPKRGMEKESYAPLLKIFTALVAYFPADRRPSFYGGYEQRIPFPFSDFAHRHHKSKPDLAVSWPGDVLPSDRKIESPHCRQFSMAIEVKALNTDDPFVKYKNGRRTLSNTRADKLVQLAVNARNLLFAHGLLAAFTLGIYGEVVRIVRFDHACAVASPPMNIKTLEGLRAIQEFFWRFVHPWEGGPGTVVGADPTVRHLTAEDKAWLKTRIGAEAGSPFGKVHFEEARWVQVWDSEDNSPAEPKAYILFKVVDVNARLFSRSTMVWKCIEDTRLRPREGPGAQAGDQEELVLQIVKEQWRQCIRTPEKEFYDRMNSTIKDPADRIGLPNMVHGCDMGKRDVKRWETAVASKPWQSDDDLLRTHAEPSEDADESEVDREFPAPVIERGYVPSLPIPMHQTHSWRLTVGASMMAKERSHMRLVVDTVGRPLDQFGSTKELVMAIYDAIRGHRTLMERGGILHRDVSSGNILIVDKQPRERVPCKGILHDYDYSSMTKKPPLAADPSDVPGQIPALHPLERMGDNEPENVAELKERTGTYYFISVDLFGSSEGDGDCVLHDTHHDLESFIWVLVWIVLRHVRHGHKRGREACSLVFKYGDDDAASSAKRIWLMDCATKPLSIPGNSPLTDLLMKLHEMLSIALVNVPVSNRRRLTYDTVLATFETAIKREDWPKDDKALPFVPPKTEKLDTKSEDFDNDPPTALQGVCFDADVLDSDEHDVDEPNPPEVKHQKKRTHERFADEEESELPSFFTETRSDATGSRKRQRNNQGVAARSSAGPRSSRAARGSVRGTSGGSGTTGGRGTVGSRRAVERLIEEAMKKARSSG
ncbi:hypothetical protein BC628DRAFT_1322948 [Trametes gibbosa]|nr:hypothetical protein BC628DRAFT_1322948 [Trametes gibbosa]